MRPFLLGSRPVGPGQPCLLVAELSANHNGDFERACRIVQAAAEAGADAIKVQTYTAETITLDGEDAAFAIQGTLWDGLRLADLYRKAALPWAWHEPLRDLARTLGLEWFSTPFDESAVDFLEKLEPPCYKTASLEIVDIPLLRHIAATGRPVIVSTGGATREEIMRARAVFAQTPGVLLHCVAAYPAAFEEMRLRTLADMPGAFGWPAGLSDHSPGYVAPVAAVSLGACVVEKHFTLRRADGGPDAAFSLEPEEFAALVRAVRQTEAALGHSGYGPTPSEQKSLAFRPSIWVTRDMEPGERFTLDNIGTYRPNQGLPPVEMDVVLGRRAARRLLRNKPLRREDVA